MWAQVQSKPLQSKFGISYISLLNHYIVKTQKISSLYDKNESFESLRKIILAFVLYKRAVQNSLFWLVLILSARF